MFDISEFGHNIAIPYDLVNDGKVTNNFWPTDQLIIVKMRDGSYTLGANVRYQNQQGTETIETRKVLLNDEGIPFVSILAGHDFTKDNCDSDIISQKHINGDLAHVVSGSPVLTVTNGEIDTTSSVFSFTEESKSVRYFSAYGNTACLNQHGLALIAKFVEHPDSQRLIQERTAVTTPAEIEFLSKEMKTRFDKFLTGRINWQEMGDLCKSFEELSNKCHMDGNTLSCNLVEVENFFNKNGQTELAAGVKQTVAPVEIIEEYNEADDEVEPEDEEVTEMESEFDGEIEDYNENEDEYEIENDELEEADDEFESEDETFEETGDEFASEDEDYEVSDDEFDGEDLEEETEEFDNEDEYESEDEDYEESDDELEGEDLEEETDEFEGEDEYENEDEDLEEESEEEEEEQPSRNRFAGNFRDRFKDRFGNLDSQR